MKITTKITTLALLLCFSPVISGGVLLGPDPTQSEPREPTRYSAFGGSYTLTEILFKDFLSETQDLKTKTLSNEAAYIPPQCYTETIDEQGAVHNPCFSCHTQARRPNYFNDEDLQHSYSFPFYAETNRWTNLFVDRRDQVAAIGDAEILDYIRRDNYLNEEGEIILAKRLAEVPAAWDYDEDGRWDGYVPDAWFSFDEQGFDRGPGGDYSGWVAFAYYPFLGTFWPTNGSTDDVLIRLPEAFRQDAAGAFDARIYKINLAIIESLIKEQDIGIEPIEESLLGGVDIDKNGEIGSAERVAYAWNPAQGEYMWAVGKANAEQQAGRIVLSAGLYPRGTEFLHSVRYIDLNDAGDNLLAPRMKELRYARKTHQLKYYELQIAADREFKENHDFPDRLRQIRGDMEKGVDNGLGWNYAAFIEDPAGDLRPQTYEELTFCVGCHGGMGATRDTIFSFHRKFDHNAHAQGWYHWSQKGLKGVPERIRSDGEPEYSYYLRHNGAGDEFRGNREVWQRFYDDEGGLKAEMINALRDDISTLLFASRERALKLNKAYRVIVMEQSFAQGRDATVEPVANVHRQVDGRVETGVEESLLGY